MLPTPLRHEWMTEEIEMLRAQARRFVEARLAPELPRWRAQGFADKGAWRPVGEMGMLLPELPEAFGGAGGTLAHQLVVQEEFARAELPASAGVHCLVAHYLLDCGTEEQKQRWLPRMASGELLAGIAMTEPGAGSDLQAVRTRALRDGDHYVINGAKTFITNGHSGDLLAVVVKTDPTLGAKGISLIVIETAGLAGFRVGRILEKIGNAASDTCELFFDDVRVPAENLIGGVEGQGFAQLMSQLPFERMMIAVTAAAVIERALELTIAYTKERKAFGQPLFDFQNTRFKLAECATTAHVVRSFVNDCIQRLVQGRLEAEAAYMAKWWCTEQQCRVLDECLQLFGGYGYMSEYPIARMYADARVQKIYGGANEVMKELIGRRL
ncbi:MAG TPA: acyl-CoA dehydrogenase family protein [Burkholderiaceae bacterium]|jgi:acyl-CoA dehydrogenase